LIDRLLSRFSEKHAISHLTPWFSTNYDLQPILIRPTKLPTPDEIDRIISGIDVAGEGVT